MDVTLRIGFLLYTLGYLIGNSKGNVYQNFSCITYNWDEYLVCSWTVSSQFNNPAYNTTVTWKLQSFGWSSCPELSSDTCTWSLGGNDKDTDPHQPIRVCLHLQTDKEMIEPECHRVDTENLVKPATVTDLIAKSQDPNCIAAKWTHEKVEPSKMYYVEITSQGLSTITKTVHMDSFYDYYDSSDYYDWSKSGAYANVTICGLSNYTTYTLSVMVRAIDEEDNQIGYWSDSLDITVVTPKTVPSGPPYLPPGGYTLSAVNNEGYRMARAYWEVLPRHAWNGDNITYEMEAIPVGDCGSRTVRLSVRETSAEFDIMYTCPYNIKVRTRNEIGRSKDASVLHLNQHALSGPREVFMTEGHAPEMVNITWREPNDVNWTTFLTYTVYWCPKSPRRSCKGSFNSRTVNSPITYRAGYFRTTVLMEGYPNITYIYGVSTEQSIAGTVVSSGFVWTDCSMASSDTLKYPRISFEGFPSEERVRMAWIYWNCAQTMITKSYSVQYDITSCSSDTCDELTTDEALPYVDLYSIPAGQQVCVTIAVRLDTASGQPSGLHCYTQSLLGTQHPLHAVLVVLVSVSGGVLVAIIATILCVAFKWWRRPTKCNIPQRTLHPNFESDKIPTGDAENPLVNGDSVTSSGRTTQDAEEVLLSNAYTPVK